MPHDFSGLSKEEQLRAENDFLKMKLMLQHGAQLEIEKESDLPPQLENEFLNHVLDFEKQYAESKRIRLRDKLGNPTHFLPIDQIPEMQIEEAWQSLSAFLIENGFELTVISPSVTSRELYRFTLEELFEEEVDDIDIPGMTSGFIYDEFHPDPIYESENVVERFFKEIFSVKLLDEYFWGLHHSGVKVNGRFFDNPDKGKEYFNQFKSQFSSINLVNLVIEQKELLPSSFVLIKGTYKAMLEKDGTTEIISGTFSFVCAPDYYRCWHIKEMKIEGIFLDH